MTERKLKFIGANPNISVAELVLSGLKKKNEPMKPNEEFVISLKTTKIPTQEALNQVVDMVLETRLFKEINNKVGKPVKKVNEPKKGDD